MHEKNNQNVLKFFEFEFLKIKEVIIHSNF